MPVFYYLLIYGGLAYLGATSSIVLGNNNLNQAQLIVAITNHLMGHTGMVILGIIVGFACLTTAVGLIGSTACFFEDFTNKKNQISCMGCYQYIN